MSDDIYGIFDGLKNLIKFQKEIKNLLNLNYKEILKNQNEIFDNNNDFNKKFDELNNKLDKIIEKLI